MGQRRRGLVPPTPPTWPEAPVSLGRRLLQARVVGCVWTPAEPTISTQRRCRPPTLVSIPKLLLGGQGRSPARLVRPNARPSPLLWEEFSRLYWSGARFLPEFTVWLTSLAALPPRKPRLIGSLAGLKVELRFYHLFHAQCSCGGEFLLLRPCLSCRGVGLEPSLLRCPPPGRGGERGFWRGPDLVSDLNSSLIPCVIWNKFCFSGPRFPHLVK